jgi:outer membrane protein
MTRNIQKKAVFFCFLLLSIPFAEACAEDSWQEIGSKRFETEGIYNQVTDSKNWNVTVGAGGGFGPAYEGSDKTEFFPVPVVDVRYKDGLFFAGTQGIGTTVIDNDDANLSFALGYGGGRDEKDDRKNLRGLGDVDSSALGIVSGEYNLGPVTLGASVQSGLGGDYGTTGDFSVGSGYPISDKLMISGDIHTAWASGDHMENYFGVSQKQSTSSGKKRFDAESGIKSYGVSLGANYQISEKWAAFADVGVDQLTGDAADSPVSVEDNQINGFVGVGYSF